MFAVSPREHHRQRGDTITVQDQLQDLTLKYETLLNQHKTTTLECKEYQTQIAILNNQTADLQKELNHYKDHHTQAEHLKPMLKLHIDSIQSSITDSDKKLMELQEKHVENVKLLNATQSENIAIKQVNSKYRTALENARKKQNILTQIHKNTVAENHIQISAFENELKSLRDQLHAFSTAKYHSQRSLNHIKCATEVLPDHAPVMNVGFIKSDMTISSPPALVDMFSYRSETVDMSYEQTQERLERLEMENAELTQKLAVFSRVCSSNISVSPNGEIADEHQHLQYSADMSFNISYDINSDSESDIMTEFDESDIDELEQLFQNCDSVNCNRNIVAKGMNKSSFHTRKKGKKMGKGKWMLWSQMFK